MRKRQRVQLLFENRTEESQELVRMAFSQTNVIVIPLNALEVTDNLEVYVTLPGASWSLEAAASIDRLSLIVPPSGGQDLDGEFDPGSGRTLAACLTHASRTGTNQSQDWRSASGERVRNT